MGLSVSQVRLLALTSRKADVELQMQVDSKRKQMLTRQSTELSQQYYQRLQNSTIQYATSSGYEDVNYSYLMGQTTSGHITDEFYEQLLTGADNNVALKSEYNMILTNNYGEVVVDNDLGKYIALAKNSYDGKSTLDKTAGAISNLISDHKGGSQQQLSVLATELDSLGSVKSHDIIMAVIKNGGYKSGGTLYRSSKDANTYYKTAAAAAKAEKDSTSVSSSDKVTPQDGYVYDVQDSSSRSIDVGKMWYGGGFVSTMTTQYAKYLGALVSYFAPIMSAAIQNGMSCKVDTSPTSITTIGAGTGSGTTQTFNGGVGGFNGVIYSGKNYCYDTTGGTKKYKEVSGKRLDAGTATEGQFNSNASYTDDMTAYAINYLSHQSQNTYVAVTNGTQTRYFLRGNDYSEGTGSVTKKYIRVKEVTKADVDKGSLARVTGNNSYTNAQDTEKLQAGFQSGTYQLAMVDDIERGSYKRNTMLNYFTQMNYVVDKTDSSKREELTAWFNAEQAAISEKETYWDAEIQNLSTELTSVNAEIESVKTLKSNAIKSVFDWGGS